LKPETIAKANVILARIVDVKGALEQWRNRSDPPTIESVCASGKTGIMPETSRLVWQKYRHDSVQALEDEQVRLERELDAL
jgi:hypothetical protein